MTYVYFSSVIVSGFRIYCICERNVSKIFFFLKKVVDSIKLGLTVFSLTNLANAKILVTTTTATTATATTKNDILLQNRLRHELKKPRFNPIKTFCHKKQ